jgi:hypothetical protein
MAKHIYHIPFNDTQNFIKTHKSTIIELISSDQSLQYNSHIGKAYYELAIKEFVEFFKIDSDIDYAVQTQTYFKSSSFFEYLFELLNLNQFPSKSPSHKTNIFYGFCVIFASKDRLLFDMFFQKAFLHFFSQFSSSSPINIDYKNILELIAKQHNQHLKESFGQDDSQKSYFKIYLDDELIINIQGKSIKSLRKKAYKKALNKVIIAKH